MCAGAARDLQQAFGWTYGERAQTLIDERGLLFIRLLCVKEIVEFSVSA